MIRAAGRVYKVLVRHLKKRPDESPTSKVLQEAEEEAMRDSAEVPEEEEKSDDGAAQPAPPPPPPPSPSAAPPQVNTEPNGTNEGETDVVNTEIVFQRDGRFYKGKVLSKTPLTFAVQLYGRQVQGDASTEYQP